MRNILAFVCILLLYGDPSPAAELFPAIDPNKSGMLQVDELHSIYWEESGNPTGIPVIFLHGGPGSGTETKQRTFFDPHYYRIILFDQRGCGKSIPRANLNNNTTWDLVEDINKLRNLLNIDRCILFGGSWGSTLALTYAIQYPQHVAGLILRGIFLCQQNELDWFYKEGAHNLSPQAWKIFRERISEEERHDLIAAYQKDLRSNSSWIRQEAAAAWVLWEFANSQATPDVRLKALMNSNIAFYAFAYLYSDMNESIAKIESSYFVNKCFFESDNWLLENIHKIQEIPGIIIQGENDQICPLEYAEQLHAVWPTSIFWVISKAGHSSYEPAVHKALLEATNIMKSVDLY